jgi:hypothetical protein
MYYLVALRGLKNTQHNLHFFFGTDGKLSRFGSESCVFKFAIQKQTKLNETIRIVKPT